MIKTKMRGTEALIQSLLNEGVDTIFGYPGGTIMPLYDELFNFCDRLNHVLVRHEQGAVHAAEGYARATGKVGVCLATAGPGATNLVTGIADAMMDSTPIVCITAQVMVDKLGSNFFQEADTISITLPITKWNFQITKAQEIAEVIAKAFYIAKTGRPGPVLVSFTRNAQIEMVEFNYKSKKFIKKIKQPDVSIDESVIEESVNLINNSKKPLILVGQGVIISGAESILLELAEKGNIPMSTTLMGISAIPTNHPLFVGNLGMHGNIAPNMMTQESDLILAIGMRFSDRVTGDTGKYAPKAKIIHIDIDKAEINKVISVDIPINADAKLVLEKMIDKISFCDRKEWLLYAKSKWKEENMEVISGLLNRESAFIRMAHVVDQISNMSGGDAIIVTDVGQNQMFCARYSSFIKSRSLITSGGLGTMGFGLPAAIGAKMGSPDRQVIAVLGDGGFQMSMQELGTIMQSQVGVKIVVLNNSFLGMVRQWQELFYNQRYSSTEMLNPNFVDIARAYNIKATKVEDPLELNNAVKEMLEWSGPYFLEVTVMQEENVFPMIPSGTALDNILY